MIAINALRPWWFVLLIVLVACAAVWSVAAGKRRQLWVLRSKAAAEYVRADQNAMSAKQLGVLARHNARWAACLAKPFAPAHDWPLASDPGASNSSHLEPGHIAALHQRDVQLEDAHIPPQIRFDVEGLRRQKFLVRIDGDAVIAIAPDGQTAQISRSSIASRSAGSGLHKMRWLEQLEGIGARIQIGPQGKRFVAAGD